MKNFILLLFLCLVTNVYSQDTYQQVVDKFYQRIDSLHKFQCSDTGVYSYAFTMNVPLYELPMDSRIDLTEYENTVMMGYSDVVVDDLVNFYYSICSDTRKKFTKSRYKFSEHYTVEHNDSNGLYWVDCTLKFTFLFQSDNPEDFKPWWKKLFKK
jgi:hypothetical protein